MKWIFRKSKAVKGHTPVARIADRLVDAVLKAQRSTADKLNHAASGWSGLKKRIALYLFCLVFGGGSMVVMVDAINQPVQKSVLTIPAPVIRLPVHPKEPDMDMLRQSEVRELEKLQSRLDSLPADSVPPQVRAQLEQLKQLVNQ